MLDVEVIGLEAAAGDGPTAVEIEELCALALAAVGVEEGHLAIELVDAETMHELNRDRRAVDAPTDVLSFPVDADGPAVGPRELGDVVICPAEADDVREAVLHGVLHLGGMDNERDGGEMLALQREVLRWLRPPDAGPAP